MRFQYYTPNSFLKFVLYRVIINCLLLSQIKHINHIIKNIILIIDFEQILDFHDRTDTNRVQ